MSRFLYKVYFYLRTTVIKLKTRRSFKVWYRNSLYQNYFQFGRSDIDISLYFACDQDLVIKAQEIELALRGDLLIKECHFYYPWLLKNMDRIGNHFELKRDPDLLKQFSINKGLAFNEAEKTVYLLRMYFSNVQQLNRHLKKRDLLKWNYHFSNVGLPPVKDLAHLKDLIVAPMTSTGGNYLEALNYLAEAFLQKKPLHLIWQDSPCPDETMVLLSHQFCFTGHVLKDLAPLEEEIIISQLAWEIWGMMSAPQQFFLNSPVFIHLNNLSLFLKRCHFLQSTNEEKRKDLILVLEEFRSVINH